MATEPSDRRTRGLDISHHQPIAAIQWDRVAEWASFAIVRATYGTRRDELFAEHARRAWEAGLRVGAYHFFRQNESGIDQAGAFVSALNVAGAAGVDFDVLAIDLEDNGRWDGPLDHKIYNGRSRECHVNMRWCGIVPHVYASPAWHHRLSGPEWWADAPLWVAHWTSAKTPSLPPTHDQWSIWQYAVDEVPGVHGPVDLNRTYGQINIRVDGRPSLADALKALDVLGDYVGYLAP